MLQIKISMFHSQNVYMIQKLNNLILFVIIFEYCFYPEKNGFFLTRDRVFFLEA